MLEHILADTAALGFAMASEPAVGALLATLAAGKPGALALEIGTGTGVGTAWLLHGLDATARLISIDNDARAQAVAARHLGQDPRLSLVTDDGGAWLEAYAGPPFDLIFADSWPGKFTHLNHALGLLAPGGLYVIDDLLPQPNWPPGHAERVPPLLGALAGHPDLHIATLLWASGVLIAARR